MGVKLGDLVVKHPLAESDLTDKVITIDAYNMLYQFLSSIRTPEGFPLTAPDGRIVSHIKGLLGRTANLLSASIRPVFIFDGVPHPLKRGTLDLRRERKERAQTEWERALEEGDMERARSKARQTSRITEEMANDAWNLLTLLGLPCIRAKGEGEAQAAHICMKKEAYAVCSQDFDSLLFGAPILLRNMATTGRRKLPGRNVFINVVPERIDLGETLDQLGLSRDQLIDLAILMGTDFNEGVPGIGPKKGLALIKEMGSLEEVSRIRRLPLLEWDEVRKLFRDPQVYEDYSLSFKDPDLDAVKALLVGELSFSEASVEGSLKVFERERASAGQSSLDSFFA
ncbi:MAG: flap endonuclease-1 [Candidatus Thermoplasmatota archaeon]|jgi:flap endonuclease-1|nr:flap endonuclease-1 [Candidatus Thermoplasmatota archaeon]